MASGYLNNWIADFLADRQQEVVLEGIHSSITQETSVVSQGRMLGSLRFLVYINNMPEGIDSVMWLLADDSLINRIVRIIEDQAKFQDDLCRLQEWERNLQMQFNTDNCEAIKITDKRKPIICSYNIYNQQLQSVKRVKVPIGATISSDLFWN